MFAAAPQTHELFYCLLVAFTHSQRGLGGGQPGNGDAIGRATDIVEADHVEELDAVGVATVLTADAHFQGGVGFPAVHYRHADELADAVAVDRLEGVDGKNLDFPICAWFIKAIDVFEQELALGIVAADAKGCLRQVVGAEAEELGYLGNLRRRSELRAAVRS